MKLHKGDRDWFSNIDGENVNQMMIERIHEIYPKGVETVHQVKERTLHVEHDIKSYMALNPGKRVAMVGHNMMFRVMTASEGYWERAKSDPLALH